MASVTYATAEDIELPPDTLAQLDPAWVTEALAKASSVADGYLANKYVLPLVPPYSLDLVQAVASIATYRIMKRRGYSPQTGDNDEIRDGYTDAMKWLRDVADGKTTPQMRGSDSQAAPQEGGGPGSATFALQPPGTLEGAYSRDEDFWHDRASAGTTGPRKRGW